MTTQDPYSLGGWWRQQVWRGLKHVLLVTVIGCFFVWFVLTHPRHRRHHYAPPPSYRQQAPVPARPF